MRWMFALVAISVAATPLEAQRIDSPYRFVDSKQELNAFAGYVFTDPGVVDLGPEDAMAFGLRYAIRVTGPFELEGQAMVLPTNRMVRDTAISTNGADTSVVSIGETSLTVAAISASLRFDLTGPRTWHGVMPFVDVGIGGVFRGGGDDSVNADLDPDLRYRFKTGLLGELGAGFEWIPTDRWSVRVDARDVLWKVRVPLALRSENVASEEWTQNFALSAGLALRF